LIITSYLFQNDFDIRFSIKYLTFICFLQLSFLGSKSIWLFRQEIGVEFLIFPYVYHPSHYWTSNHFENLWRYWFRYLKKLFSNNQLQICFVLAELTEISLLSTPQKNSSCQFTIFKTEVLLNRNWFWDFLMRSVNLSLVSNDHCFDWRLSSF
jgi:hypothetical protein